MPRRRAACAVLALVSFLAVLAPLTIGAPTTAAADPLQPLCRSSVGESGGRFWRPARCADPGFANRRVPPAPVVNEAETTVLRTLPRMILNIGSYAEPVYYASASTPMRRTRCVTWGCVGGSSVPLEGTEVVAPGNDGQLVVVDSVRGLSYEMYDVERDSDGTVRIASDGSVTMGSMSVVDLHGRGNTTAEGERLNITGSGVSRILGLIRAHEVRAAGHRPRTAIRHALQVSLPSSMNCSDEFRAPATKTDGRATTSRCVEEGARLHLSRSFECRTVEAPLGRAVCFALRRHGAYVMDNNGSDLMAVYGQQRDSWPTGAADYAAAGVRGDYQDLGIPMSHMRSLASWDGS